MREPGPVRGCVYTKRRSHNTVESPAVRGVASGTTSRFLSFGSTVAAPVAIGFPLSSLSSTPENFAITPSLKFNLISVGELAAEMFACGLVAMGGLPTRSDETFVDFAGFFGVEFLGRRCQNRGLTLPPGSAWGMPETAQGASGM